MQVLRALVPVLSWVTVATIGAQPAPQLGIPLGSTIRVQSGIRRIGTVNGIAVGITYDSLRLSATDKSGISVIPVTAAMRVSVRSDSGWRTAVLTGARVRLTNPETGRASIGVLDLLSESPQVIATDTVSARVLPITPDSKLEVSIGEQHGPVKPLSVLIGAVIGGVIGRVSPDACEDGGGFFCFSRNAQMTLGAVTGMLVGAKISMSRGAHEGWLTVHR